MEELVSLLCVPPSPPGTFLCKTSDLPIQAFSHRGQHLVPRNYSRNSCLGKLWECQSQPAARHLLLHCKDGTASQVEPGSVTGQKHVTARLPHSRGLVSGSSCGLLEALSLALDADLCGRVCSLSRGEGWGKNRNIL